jgi:hypothetical protein
MSVVAPGEVQMTAPSASRKRTDPVVSTRIERAVDRCTRTPALPTSRVASWVPG